MAEIGADPARGADARQDRHHGGRGARRRSARNTCARSRTRSGTCCPGRHYVKASCAPTRTSSASTRGRWSRSTSCATSARPSIELRPITPPGARRATAARGRARAAPPRGGHRGGCSDRAAWWSSIAIGGVQAASSSTASTTPPATVGTTATTSTTAPTTTTPCQAAPATKVAPAAHRRPAPVYVCLVDADGARCSHRRDLRRRPDVPTERSQAAADARQRRPFTMTVQRVDGAGAAVDRAAIGYELVPTDTTCRRPASAPSCASGPAALSARAGDPRHRHRGADRAASPTATGRGCPSACASSASTSRTIADRRRPPDGHARGARAGAARGVDADRHQRRPRADRRRPDGARSSASSAAARWCSTSALEERIAEILRR